MVLYELTTGKRAFGGSSALATLTAILRDEPKPLRQLRPEAPAALEQVIVRCLRKKAAERFASAEEVGQALARAVEKKDVDRRWMAAAAAVLVLAGGAGWWWNSGRRPAGPVAVKMTPITSLPGTETCPRWSPDGKRIAFWHHDPNSQESTLYVRDLADGATKKLAGGMSRWWSGVAWAPDGQRVPVLRPDALVAIPTDRETPDTGGERITAAPRLQVPGAPNKFSWSPDGDTIPFSDSSGPRETTSVVLYSIRDKSRRYAATATDGIADLGAAFSRDGKQIAFIWRFHNARYAVFTVGVKGGEAQRVGPDFVYLSTLDWGG